MGPNFYLKSPKEQMAPLECQEESGIGNWSYNQKAILLDASTWKWKEKNILLYPSSKGYLSDYKSINKNLKESTLKCWISKTVFIKLQSMALKRFKNHTLQSSNSEIKTLSANPSPPKHKKMWTLKMFHIKTLKAFWDKRWLGMCSGRSWEMTP